MNWMGNGQSGTWSFDDGADVWETYDDIMFVFVDGVGAIVGYLIDPDSGNTDSGTYATPFLIPPFTATGGGSNSKNVSHVSVYHTENGNGDGGGPPSQIPEPNIVALLGAAFLGLFLIRRRVLKQPS